MELSKYLRSHARTIAGKQQLIITVFSKALEVIPRTLCDNAGFDSANILNKLRQKHAQDLGMHAADHDVSDVFAGGLWYGVDVFHEDFADNFEATVWDPSLVKINALTAAAEVAALILSVDETVKDPTSNIVCLCFVWMADAGRPGHRHREVVIRACRCADVVLLGGSLCVVHAVQGCCRHSLWAWSFPSACEPRARVMLKT
jgi:hypothetical protein